MKNVRSISCENEKISACKLDLKEIDNEDKYNLFRLHYLERVRGFIKTAERYYSGKRILEVRSAQSNISLLLAEKEFFYDRSRD